MKAAPDPQAAARQEQLKAYEDALVQFQQQKFHRAKQVLEKVLEGPSRELRDRALVHIRICDQRIARAPAPAAKTVEDHYTQGVALMNLAAGTRRASISIAPERPRRRRTTWY